MKLSKKNCDLESCVFCKLCLPEWLPAISSHRKTLLFKKGEVLFNEGDPVTDMYFIYDGIAKVHKKWGDEKELILRFALKGDILGHRGLGAGDYYPMSATALEPLTVCFFDLPFFMVSLKVNHDYALNLLLFFAEELKESEKNMRNLAHMSVKGRVANALLRLKDKFGVTKEGPIDMTISRQDIASFAGTTYETVFRTMIDLADNGIIETNGKEITIKDLKALADLTKEA